MCKLACRVLSCYNGLYFKMSESAIVVVHTLVQDDEDNGTWVAFIATKSKLCMLSH